MSMLNYRELTEDFIQTKSEKSFTTLYNRIKPGLTAYVYKIVKDSEIAEDIAVNTLTKMWTKIDQYDPKYIPSMLKKIKKDLKRLKRVHFLLEIWCLSLETFCILMNMPKE